MELIGLRGIPIINGPTNLSAVLIATLNQQNIRLVNGDVLVIAHKLVSKAEGQVVALERIVPGPEAEAVAARTGKDPRLVELILQESAAIIRENHGVLITEHRIGTISANAAVDQSNAGPDGKWAVLLPKDPDQTAARLQADIEAAYGVEIGVIISDTQGRPFRLGAVGVAIGVAGLVPLVDWRGCRDLYGYTLHASEEAVADELAAAATLLMGQSQEGIPAILVRGWRMQRGEGTARELLRPREKDLFR
jgi:coenzyme F420-0:L-glutamate ligase / coenzyme F420-1:gamma-L-glutamate ligase